MPPDSPPVPRRQRLVRLRPRGWAAILARDWDPVARACLAHWAADDLPLVTTTQRGGAPAGDPTWWLGLAAPLCWERRRLALQVPPADIVDFGDFPEARAIAGALPASLRPDWDALLADLAAAGATVRVFGSYGWQQLTGLVYVREGSDLDLCVRVADAHRADAVVARLAAFAPAVPRLDGELVFDGGDAVHWREWAPWRAGAVRQLLVKRLQGAVLASHWPAGSQQGSGAGREAMATMPAPAMQETTR
ncbi:malonate decarboxylase holo-[acyl-carrier-protein] synthase [Xylophilus sp. Kf1]|nr:malonate decarboxylase holo-[acyl-carrier-protein] synthase [Xylophilus sp. Kf1]